MGLSGRLSATKICGVLLVALSAVMACSGGGDDEGSAAGGSVWAPTTVAFDPECKGCEEIGLVVTDVQGRYDLMGLPNVLTWRTAGLVDGTQYTLQVSGVAVDDAARDFEYTFVLLPQS